MLVLAALLAAPVAAGTILVKLDLADLVERSQLVFEGVVLERVASWKDGRIVTRNTLSVDVVLESEEEAPHAVSIVTPGGEVGDVGLWVPGASRFVVAERYLVFARRSGSAWRVTGMAQGCLRIVTDETGLHWALPPATTGLVAWKQGQLVPAQPFMKKPVPLADLEHRILELAGETP